MITNNLTGRAYIGSTNNLYRREVEHFSLLRNGRHQNKPLQVEFSVLSEESFSFTVLVVCDKEDAAEIEQTILESSVPGGYVYNLSDKASGGRSPEKMQEMRSFIKNRFRGKHSAETRKRMSDARRGSRRSQETKLKMRSSNAMSAPVIIDGRRFPSTAEASRVLGIRNTTITSRINSKYFANYQRVE